MNFPIFASQLFMIAMIRITAANKVLKIILAMQTLANVLATSNQIRANTFMHLTFLCAW